MADSEEKTLEPTEKKLEDARAKGDVPSAPEMRHAVMFVALLIIVGMLGLHMAQVLASLSASIWEQAGTTSLTAQSAPRFTTALMAGTMTAIGPILILTLIMAVLSLFLQGRPSLSLHRLSLKWDRLNPMAGAKRLLGKQAWVEFAKTLAKFAIVAGVVSFIAWPAMSSLSRLVGADVASIGQNASSMVMTMVRTAAMIVGALALADFVYQRRTWLARMRMSLQEVKDEHKQSEGDPHIKQRIRSIAMQRASRRMMSAVPDASVILTNPTHYSVALKYEHGSMRAPIVVAKGVDTVAFKIREVAGAANVPIIESPPLARALYASVEIDHPIPVDHYAAVAEIISYVMKLTRDKRM
jgi:flagellar biosynthesis protein FlhB